MFFFERLKEAGPRNICYWFTTTKEAFDKMSESKRKEMLANLCSLRTNSTIISNMYMRRRCILLPRRLS